MDENKQAANSTVENNAATTAENPATSQNNMGTPTASATEQNTASMQQNNAGKTVTETQIFAQRLKEEKEKAKAEARAELEKEYTAKSAIVEPHLTRDEKQALRAQRSQYENSLIAQGIDPSLAHQQATEYYDEQKEDLLDTKREQAEEEAKRKTAEEKAKLDGLSKDEKIKALEKQVEELTATKKAEESNKKAAAASVGSLKSDPANDPDFVTSEQWDKLPREKKRELVKNRKVYDFMKKWQK